MGTEDYIQLPKDSSGKKLRAVKETVGPNEVFMEVNRSLMGMIAEIPPGKSVTKIEFWKDANNKTKYIKFYDGAELILTLTNSLAGAATEATYSWERS